jgi:hypothetical protein
MYQRINNLSGLENNNPIYEQSITVAQQQMRQTPRIRCCNTCFGKNYAQTLKQSDINFGQK